MRLVEWISIVGLITNFVGVILLFRYGMPYRLRTGGDSIILTRQTPGAIREEIRYDRWGWIGLALIILGTLVQIGVFLRVPV
jgi:hypothetical protein